MGSYIDYFGVQYDNGIENAEFNRKIEELFWRGGMMKVNTVQMYGMEFHTLQKATLADNPDGLDFVYNYFEEVFWENSGYNAKDQSIYSNKVGTRCFSKVILAAYVLKSLCSECPLVMLFNRAIINKNYYIGWINEIFDESNLAPISEMYEVWPAYEFMHYNCPYKIPDKNMSEYEIYDAPYCILMYAVEHGCNSALEFIEKYRKDGKEHITLDAMKIINTIFQSFKDKHDADNLIDMLIQYIDKGNVYDVECEDDAVRHCCVLAISASIIQFLVKLISENYERDFWELWSKVRPYYHVRQSLPERIETTYFLRCVDDDLIVFWHEGCDIQLSDDLKLWFDELKNEYKNVIPKKYTIKEIVKLLHMLEVTYMNVFTFNNFFEESIENLNNEKYQKLWVILENIINSEAALMEADEIKLKCENSDFGLYGISASEKVYRTKLRRYMAVCGNSELRNSIFGF